MAIFNKQNTDITHSAHDVPNLGSSNHEFGYPFRFLRAINNSFKERTPYGLILKQISFMLEIMMKFQYS
jgi:hypothetical protein